MPTKSARKAAASSNGPVVNFFMAEDFRQEINGKITAIGLYADHVAVLQVPENIPDPTEDAPLMIKSIGFLFSVSKLTTDTTVVVENEVNGIRIPFIEPTNCPAPGPGRSFNLLGIITPCPVSSFGERTLHFIIDGSEYRFKYEIRRVNIPAVYPPPAVEPEAPIKQTSRPRARRVKAPSAK